MWQMRYQKVSTRDIAYAVDMSNLIRSVHFSPPALRLAPKAH
jgi:hypothetical protein